MREERRRERGREEGGEVRRVEGSKRGWDGGRIIMTQLRVAYPCEVEGVVCRDERHGIGSPLKPIDLLMRVSNQHLCTSLRLNDTDDSCMESNVKNNNWL